MKQPNAHLHAIVSHVVELENSVIGPNDFRSQMYKALESMIEIEDSDATTFGQLINNAIQACPRIQQRPFAIAMIRLIGSSKALTEDDLQTCRREVVTFVENHCKDLTKGYINPKDQNHEKIEAISKIHSGIMSRLEELRLPFASLVDLAQRRNSIMQSINHSTCKSYLAEFGYTTFRTVLVSLLGQVENVVSYSGYEKQEAIEQLVRDIPIQIDNCAKCGTFLFDQLVKPFLTRLQDAASEMQDQLLVDFHCDFTIPKSSQDIEKRYPIHHQNSVIEVPISIVNDGPGIAQDVRLTYAADNCTIENDETYLGSVDPGPRVVMLDISLADPQSELWIEVEVTWKIVGESKSHSKSFSMSIRGQRTDIDWNTVSRQNPPYSLEVVDEKDFYGRHDVLNQIVGRLTSTDMESCFVTGQKRVGKSSLVRAVQSRIERIESSTNYRVLYLESGEFRHSSGTETLSELGSLLESFFVSALDREYSWEPQDYSSSLTALNRLVQKIVESKPAERFIVILDEFDEINESLYLHGELASTFFLNLRTLASKQNMAFVLVGAEKMPYLMSSQGERLNKFRSISLDSFDIETEWPDYRDLVQKPVENLLTIHDEALRQIYKLTDGHPYFSKALCVSVFEQAVNSRDAEVSVHDIANASQNLVKGLDTNAFAHYWRDGASGDFKNVEIVSTKRCKVLMAWARTVRRDNKPVREELRKSLTTGGQDIDLRRELEAFCSRGVFKDTNGEYGPTVELFGRWLRNGGFSSLANSQLGEEYDSEKQQIEDRAWVQADEVVALANQWSHYQGKKISTDDIRNWIQQVDSNVHQRYLFTLLKSVRFVSDEHMIESFHEAYKSISERFPWMRESRRIKRSDIYVTFVGGLTRSGVYYARKFALANRITTSNVVNIEDLNAKLNESDGNIVSSVVIVDDMIGTGDGLVEGLRSTQERLKEVGIGYRIPLYISIFCATTEGERNVTRHINSNFEECELLIHEILDDSHYAFKSEIGIWDSKNDYDRAKTLVLDLGARVDRRRSLGFKGQGLLLVFSRNCPNNSLPILYGNGRTNDAPWIPLFPRET